VNHPGGWEGLLTMMIEYSFVIPHDVKTLVKLMGGADTFEERLDLMVSEMVKWYTRGTDIC
jgi:putative alpha-1,2-mannosidase